MLGGIQFAVLAMAVGRSSTVIPLPPPPERPPPARKPGATLEGLTLRVDPTCGGTARMPMLSYRVSQARPKPPRMEVSPLLPGEYAKPNRGAQLFLGARGASNTSGWLLACGISTLGVSAIWFKACRFSPSGVVVYS